jgi:hypothetical protein
MSKNQKKEENVPNSNKNHEKTTKYKKKAQRTDAGGYSTLFPTFIMALNPFPTSFCEIS